MTINKTVSSRPHTLMIKLLDVNQFLAMEFINKIIGWPTKHLLRLLINEFLVFNEIILYKC